MNCGCLPAGVEHRYGEARTALRATTRDEEASIGTWRRIETITRQLELCGVGADEQLVLVCDESTDRTVVELFATSAERLGAALTQLVVPAGEPQRDDPLAAPVVRAAMTSADLVLDLTGSIGASATYHEVLDAARVLSVTADSPAAIDTLVAHPGLTRRLERAGELLSSGRSAVLSSAAGTILDIGLTGAAHRAPAVVASAAGQHGHWPGGAVWVRPRADIVNGTVVVMPGDVLVDTDTAVRSPVRLDVSGARVVDILGDNADADLLRSELERLDPDKPCAVAEIGFGLAAEREDRPASRWPLGRSTREAGRCSLTLRGPATEATLTITLARASFAIDQIDVVVDGALIGAVAPDVYELAAAD